MLSYASCILPTCFLTLVFSLSTPPIPFRKYGVLTSWNSLQYYIRCPIATWLLPPSSSYSLSIQVRRHLGHKTHPRTCFTPNSSSRQMYNSNNMNNDNQRCFSSSSHEDKYKVEKKHKVMVSNSKNISMFHTLVCTIGATTSTVVSLCFFTVLAYQRNAYMVTFFIGSILNGITSKILKKIINQERPTIESSSTSISTPQVERSIQPSDKGMPSR